MYIKVDNEIVLVNKIELYRPTGEPNKGIILINESSFIKKFDYQKAKRIFDELWEKMIENNLVLIKDLEEFENEDNKDSK